MSAPAASVNLVAAALQYAARGWTVFPLHTATPSGCTCDDPECENVGKHPRTRRGLHDSTTDEKTIRGWWRTWPDANIGIATGPRSRFFVLDVDEGGDETLAMLERELGELPPTVEAQTGSGGRHLLFEHVDGVRNNVGKLGIGLDIRGDGGYIVAAPSLHKHGTQYEWVHQHAPGDCEIAVAPGWLVERLREEPTPRREVSGDANVAAVKYARAALESATRNIAAATEGQRNDLLNKEAYSLFGFVASGLLASGEVEATLVEAAHRAGLPEKEVRKTLRSARAGEKAPRGAPQRDDPPPPRAHVTEPTAASTERFRLERLADLLAENIPPTRWLLTPYVPACSFGELVGPPGKGKTTFMAWMLMQMAKAGVRCAIFEEEGSRRGLQRLLSRALEAAGGGVGDNIWFAHAQHVNLLDKRDIDALLKVLKGFDFALFDSFNLVTPGLDEDKSKDMGPVISDIRSLRDALQIAAWFNHHSGKAKWKAGDVPRLGDGRGSSAWPGALDAELSMRPVEKQETGFVQFDLFVTKMREADDQVRPQRVSIARNGPAAIVEMTDLGQSDSDVDPALSLKLFDFIRKAGEEGTSKNQIENNVEGDTNRIRAALQSLKASGHIEEIPHGKYTRLRVADVR